MVQLGLKPFPPSFLVSRSSLDLLSNPTKIKSGSMSEWNVVISDPFNDPLVQQ